MPAFQKRPLTAYQKQRRKELGLEDEEELTIDQQLARLDVDLRRLKIEFDIYFNGGIKHPPYDTRNKVETAINRLSDDRSLTYAHRYKFNSLAARFAAFRDLWRRSMQSREEGRDFITVARAKLDAMRKAADEEIAARNEAAAKLLAKNALGTDDRPAPPALAVSTPLEPDPVALVPDEKPLHREPVHVKGPASLLGLVEAPKRLEPPPPLPEPLETVDSTLAVVDEPESMVPPPTQLVAESAAVNERAEELVPAGDPIDASSLTEVAEEPVSEQYDLSEEPVASGFETVEDEGESVEFAPEEPDEYASAAYEMEPADEPEPVSAAHEDDASEAQPALAEDTAEPVLAADADAEAEQSEREVIKPLGMSFPKILPPSAHQVQPPEPRIRSRRAGDRRSGDRRALPFGRRAVDREAMAGRTPEEFVAQFVNPESATPQELEVTQPESTRVVVEPVTQVQIPPTSVTPATVAAPPVADEEIAVFVFADPRREPGKVKELFAALINAKIKTGENTDDLLPSRFGHLLALRADKIRKSAKADQVIFSVAIEDGRVNLNARAEK